MTATLPIYCDYNATAPVRPAAAAAVAAALEGLGNPSSVHAPGSAAWAVGGGGRRGGAPPAAGPQRGHRAERGYSPF